MDTHDEKKTSGDLHVFVVSVSTAPYQRYTLPLIEKYCDRCGYDLTVSRKTFDRKMSPSWNKLLPFRVVGEVPFVLVLDLDCVPMPYAPPVDGIFDRSVVNMAKQVLTRRRLNRMKRKGEKNLSRFRWNSGFVGLPITYKKEWENLYSQRREIDHLCLGYEQEHLNNLIEEKKIPVNQIEEKWNCLVGMRYKPETETKVNFAHFAGTIREKIKGAKRLFEHAKNEGYI